MDKPETQDKTLGLNSNLKPKNDDEKSNLSQDDTNSIASTSNSLHSHFTLSKIQYSEIREAVVNLKKRGKDRISEEEKLMEFYLNRRTPRQFCLQRETSIAYSQLIKDEDLRALQSFIFSNSQIYDKLMSGKPLIKRQDFVLVNELSWRFLVELYNAGPEIALDDLLPDGTGKKKFFTDSPLSRNSNTNTNFNFERRTNNSLSSIFNVENSNGKDKEKEERNSSKRVIIISDPPYHKSTNIANYPNSSTQSLQEVISPEPVGLVNKRYFCYMNAVLQSLLSLDSINQYFYKGIHPNKLTIKDKCFALHYTNIIRKMVNSAPFSHIDYSELKEIISGRFDPYYHHDSQEFLRYFLSELQDELNSKPPKLFSLENLSLIHAIETYDNAFNCVIDKNFAGLLKSVIRCGHCKANSVTYNPFLDISLHLHKTSKTKLKKLLNEFFSPFKIPSYDCEGCGRKGKAERELSFGHLPKVLVLHLNRTQIISDSLKKKLDVHVTFEMENLGLSDYCGKDREKGANYRLVSLVEHSGSTEFGHYVAYSMRGGKVTYYCNSVVFIR